MDVVVDPDCEEEDILSPELRAQLGDGAVVVGKKRKKTSEPVAAPVVEEPVLSKNQRRKLESLKKRKENEAKRAIYLEEIDKHKLSESHQQLMVSARDQGQKQTQKWRLQMIIKRHKAGLDLNDEERSLLVPYLGSQVAESSDEDEEALSANRVAKKRKGIDDEAMSSTEAQYNPYNIAITEGKPTSEPVEPAASSAPVAAIVDDGLTLGQRLMAQFQQIKTKAAEDNAKQAAVQESFNYNDYSAEFAANRPAYIQGPENTTMEQLLQRHREAVANGTATTGGSSIYGGSNGGGINEKKRNFVNRKDAIQLARMQLPVCGMEQEIVEAVTDNDAIILCGETGSGKSTQVPQFLYEAGYCDANAMVGITQPRRVAASSTALRVAVEMNCPIDDGPTSPAADDADGASEANCQDKKGNPSSKSRKKQKKKQMEEVALAKAKQLVGYQVRHDASSMSSDTCIKFMTDGILLREITTDLMLRQYSVIILDEAHERNVNTDVLLGLLSRALILRKARAEEERAAYEFIPEAQRAGYVLPLKPLKLIIMSATLRIDDFLNTRLFPSPVKFPPVIKVEARQFPVTAHFSKRTDLHNYPKLVYKKVIQIHKKLPEGGILVFLTGKREIMQLTNKLRRYFSRRNINAAVAIESTTAEPVTDAAASQVGLPSVWDQGDDVASADEDGGMYHRKRRSGSGRRKEGKGSRGDEEGNDSDSLGSYDSGSSVAADSDFTSDEEDIDDITDNLTNANGSMAIEEPVTEPEEYAGERSALLRQLLMGGGIQTATSSWDEPKAIKPAATDTATESAEPASAGADGGASELQRLHQKDEEEEERPKNALVLPLFAMLSAEQQARVFQPAPAGTRLIVIATNVAETSITIPGVKYVVDCGRYKEKVIKSASGISKFEVHWISKASADQRMGRAGRTGPGHCYRLYSSAFYDQHMKQFQPPEILKTPLEDLLLQMRVLGIDDVEHFPFPTPPTRHAVDTALSTLRCIAAVSAVKPSNNNALALGQKIPRPLDKISVLGRLIAKFPIGARYAKMLVVAHGSPEIPASLACALVAVLTERPPFLSRRNSFNLFEEKKKADDSDESDENSENSEAEDTAKEKNAPPLYFHPNSDALARLRALGAYIHACSQNHRALASTKGKRGAETKQKDDSVAQFCARHSLHMPSLERSLALARQLCTLVEKVLGSNSEDEEIQSDVHGDVMNSLRPPTAEQEVALRQVLVTGLPDCIARRAKAGVITTGSRKHRLTAYFSSNPNVTKPLYIHPESCLYRKDPTAPLPEYITYGQLVENEAGTSTYMTSVSVVEASWIAELTKDCPLLKFSEPLQTPLPSYDAEKDEVRCYVVPTYGVHSWELAPVRMNLAQACASSASISSGGISGLSGDIDTDLGTLPGYRKRDEAVRWFARLVLEGSVLDDSVLRGVFTKQHIKVSPSALTALKVSKSGSQLLMQLAKAGVCTVSQLKNKLKEDQSFLYEELQACLHMEARKQFRQQWARFVKSL